MGAELSDHQSAVAGDERLGPVHLQSLQRQKLGAMLAAIGPGNADFPVYEYGANRAFALPFFGSMTGWRVMRVCDTLDTILEKTLLAKKGRF